MVLSLNNDEAAKQRAHEKLLLQMQLNERGNDDAAAVIRARQAQVANVNYMRQDAARRAQAESLQRARASKDARMQQGRAMATQNNAAGIAANAATQQASNQRRLAELTAKLQLGQLDAAQKHELEQLAIQQIQELERMQQQNQLGQGDMRLQDELRRGQAEQLHGQNLESKQADFGYGSMEAAQQQQYGMQNRQADFGYKTREQAQRDAQAARQAAFQASVEAEQARAQHGYGQQDMRLQDTLQRGQNQQRQTFGLEAQQQQQDFVVGNESLADLRKLSSEVGSRLQQLALTPDDARERDKLLAERRQILSQTPSGGQSGARQTAQRIDKWLRAVQDSNFGSRVVQEPSAYDEIDKKAVYFKGGRKITAEQAQQTGADYMILDGKEIPLTPSSSAATKVNENDPAAKFNKFLDNDEKIKRVEVGKDEYGNPIYGLPSFDQSIEEYERRQEYLKKMLGQQTTGQPQSSAQDDWWLEGAGSGVGGPSPQQQQAYISRNDTRNAMGNDKSRQNSLPVGGNVGYTDPSIKMQRLQSAGYQGPELEKAQRLMAELAQKFPNAASIEDLPPQMQSIAANAKMILDVAHGRQ